MATLTRHKTALRRLALFAAALILTLGFTQSAQQTVQLMSNRIGDQIWRWVGSERAIEQRIVVVDIDEASAARYGAWPWSRQQIAELSQRIQESGAAIQIFDMVFAENKAGDERLAQQFSQQTTVLAQILAIDADDTTQMGVLQGARQAPCASSEVHANAYIGNNKRLAESATVIGHITPHIDDDGVVRNLPAFVCYEQQSYPALAPAVLASAVKQPGTFKINSQDGWLQPSARIIHSAIPELNIPVNTAGDILLPWWLSRQSIVSVSARDILQNNITPGFLDGAWILVGSTAFGSGDAIPTPQAGLVDGIEVHAQLLSAILNNTIPYHPNGYALILALAFVLVTLAFLMLYQLKGRMIIYGPLLLAVGILFLSLLLQTHFLQSEQLWIPMLPVMIFALLSGIFMAVDGYSLVWANNQKLYHHLTSYLPPQAAKWIASQDPIDSLDAHQEQALIMYIDLRNFSNWCAHLPAEQVGAILHTFYKEVTRIVQKHGGETEKYIGDAVMVLWKKADLAVLAAAQELIKLTEEQFGDDLETQDLPPLAIGIGIEYGNVLVGSFGPAQRREYTVIGKTVSTAIKLQEMCEELAWPILIGETAANYWEAQTTLESQGKFLLPGNPQAIEIFVPKA